MKPINSSLVRALRFAGLFAAVLLLPLVASQATDQELYGGNNTLGFRVDRQRLEASRGVHPRLYLTPERIKELQRLIATDAKYGAMFAAEKRRADNFVKSGPGQIKATKRSSSGPSEVYGHALGCMAMVYKITGERAYRDAVVRWLDKLPMEGYWETKEPDLITAFVQIGAAVSYDWLYDELPPALRLRLRNKLVAEASRIHEIAEAPKRWYWNRSFLQNHLWFALNGMVHSALAVWDEEPTALAMLERATSHLSTTMSVMPTDGAAFESFGYWFYGMQPLMMDMYLSRESFGVDMFQTPYFRECGDFLLHGFLPEAAWEQGDLFFGFRDSTTHTGVRSYLFRLLARQFQDGRMQWLADRMDERDEPGGKESWLNLVWYDPGVKPVSPAEAGMPTFRHFEDSGFVFARTGWNKDAAAVQFQCGPYFGHKVSQLFNGDGGWGTGHVHPDLNHFSLLGRHGELLFVDDGYAKPKLTSNHNTLVVNGEGQLGEGEDWFKDTAASRALRPAIKRAQTSAGLDYIVGDASLAYRPGAGVARFVRHLLFLKPDVLIVVDDIKLTRSGDMELRFWPGPQTIVPGTAGEYLMAGKENRVRVTLLTPVEIKVGIVREKVGQHEKFESPTRTVIKLDRHGERWQNAVAIRWSDLASIPGAVACEQQGERWIFKVGDRSAELELTACEAKLAGRK